MALPYIFFTLVLAFSWAWHVALCEITDSSQQYHTPVPNGNDYNLLGISYNFSKQQFSPVSEKLSLARYKLAGTATSSCILFGGGTSTNGDSAVVDIYDISTYSWSTAALSLARHDLTATATPSTAFFAGGASTIGKLHPKSAVVDIFSGSPLTRSVASLSQARSALSSVAVGNLVLFAGGVVGDQETVAFSDVVDIYDVQSGVWSTSQLSLARGWLSATGLSGKAYFAGGIHRPGIQLVDFTDRVDVFDAASGVWSQLSPLSQPRGRLCAAAIDNAVLFAGGVSRQGYSVSVDVYRTKWSRWETMELTQPRATCVASPLGTGAIAVIGGITAETARDLYSSVMDLMIPVTPSNYDPQPFARMAVDNVPRPLHGSAIAYMGPSASRNGTLMVAGGIDGVERLSNRVQGYVV